MFDTYFSTTGRMSAKVFRRHILVLSIVGTILSFVIAKLLFGTFALPFVPFMPNPDPLHQAIYTILPLLLCAPIFIKRQHDRNRSPMLFIIFIGMSVGLALFGSAGTTSVHPITQVELQAFVAKNVVHAPVSILGLWLIVESCLFRGTEGNNRYGPEPMMAKAN